MSDTSQGEGWWPPMSITNPRKMLAACGCLALIGAFALGALPAAASNKQTAQPQGEAAIAQCQKAAMGHAKMTTKTVSDCSWLPPASISIDHCPASWSVDVIKVGSSTIAVRAGSVPLRLSKGYTAAQLLTAVSHLCSASAPPVTGTSAKAPKKKAQVNANQAAFLSWANQIRSDLAPCEAGSTNVLAELGIVISKGSSASASDFVTLATTTKTAAPLCAITSNNGILNINTTNPPSGYPTLKSITSDLQTWADQDNQQVVIDAGKVADSNGTSTGDVASLISDSQTADGDAATINSEMAAAASQAGVKNWKGLGLITWGLHQTGNTGSTGNTGNSG